MSLDKLWKIPPCCYYFVLFFFFACCETMGDKNDTHPEKSVNEHDGAPEWVLNGTSPKNMICGVGSASGTRKKELMRTAAQERGRTEIARQFEVGGKVLLQRIPCTCGLDRDDPRHEQLEGMRGHIGDVLQKISNMVLSLTEPTDKWVSPSGKMYIQMCLDIEKLRSGLQPNENIILDEMIAFLRKFQ